VMWYVHVRVRGCEYMWWGRGGLRWGWRHVIPSWIHPAHWRLNITSLWYKGMLSLHVLLFVHSTAHISPDRKLPVLLLMPTSPCVWACFTDSRSTPHSLHFNDLAISCKARPVWSSRRLLVRAVGCEAALNSLLLITK